VTNLSRRTLLQVGSATLLGGLAGCTGLGPSSSTPKIGTLRVENHVPEPVVVQVLVTHESEPLYWASRRTPADSPDGETLRVAFTGLPTAPGEFVLHARSHAQPPTAWETLDSREFDASCLSFIVEIGNPSQNESAEDVSIFYTTNDRGCERRPSSATAGAGNAGEATPTTEGDRRETAGRSVAPVLSRTTNRHSTSE
jgi:hypothetical protein